MFWGILHYRIRGDVYVELGVVFWALGSLTLVPFGSYLTLNNTVTFKSGLGSLKVIDTGAIRKLGCGFLFVFYSNI